MQYIVGKLSWTGEESTHLGVIEQEAYNARGQHVPDPRRGHPCQDLANVREKTNKTQNQDQDLRQGGRGRWLSRKRRRKMSMRLVSPGTPPYQ